MKSITSSLSLFLIIVLTFSSCSNTKSLPNGKTIDTRLIGTWVGSEKDQQLDGVTKEWEMLRREDGTFVLNFKFITPNDTEEGTWWVENNKFYEYHEYSGETDTYNYEVLNKDEVKFEMLNSAMSFNKDNYTFIDKRKKSLKE